VDAEFTMSPIAPSKQSITVEDKTDPSTATPISTTGAQMKELSGKPATVRDALPVIPGVARTVEGGLTISDQPEHRSTLLVNSLDATDPVTGRFGATVPIDSVPRSTSTRIRSLPSTAASAPAWSPWKPSAAATSGTGN